ncbi:hypothetical protein [Streptomyces sp. ME19-01-6]|uniref:hypothetical protein n=1 Tax=Streptomyces sp. ME19-01-6 TaxID=3028686 RepID=UPI0029A8EA8E|nr:hypothetical protein [Streptomyces sp. ME19-01-6]MDX3230568.1 hypothetical protein [Streptomyces sp. ME19-01-6]
MTKPRPTQTAVLDAGLRWLFETEQPADAWAQHHGEMIPADGNRTYSFVPVGARQHPVVVVDVAKVEWINNGPNQLQTPANPLEPGELQALAAELERRGFAVEATWNGSPGAITGSVGLARPAHPTQVAAVERYHAGCQQHPRRSVFCECEAWLAGFRRVVQPVIDQATCA